MRYMDQDYNYRPPNSFLPSGIGSFYNQRPVYPGQRNIHEGFGTADLTSTFEPPERTGFLSGITGPVMGGLKWLGEKFKRPEAKQRFYDEVMQGRSIEPWQTGMYKGNEYGLYNSPSGLKVSSDIIGWGEGREKNLDSMFGSSSIEEMEQKKLEWALDRIKKGKSVHSRFRPILDQQEECWIGLVTRDQEELQIQSQIQSQM